MKSKETKSIQDKYLNVLPEEIRNAVKPLAKETDLIIFGFLKEKNKAAFKNIMSSLNLNSNTISRSLKRLLESGLVDSYLEREIGREYSYYTPSLLGNLIIEKLVEVDTKILKNEI